MHKEGTSTKGRETVPDVYRDLMSTHLGFSKHEQDYELLPEHHEPAHHAHPAHRHGMFYADLIGTNLRSAGRPHAPIAQGDFWPGSAFVPISIVTSAFFDLYQQQWMAMTSPHWIAGAYERLETRQDELAGRLAAVERLLAGTKSHEHDEGSDTLVNRLYRGHESSTTIDADEVADQLTEYLPTIASCFEERFGAAANVELKRADASALPVVVVIDASNSDWEVVANARRSGARMRFYESVFAILPDDVADVVDFEFIFPTK